jgi:hypothetical protein
MILGKFTVAAFLLTAPVVWGQFSRTDMMKLATDRSNAVAKTLKLSPDQAAKIQPLIEAKYVDIGQVKDVYRSSDKSAASKKTAKESLKSIDNKYNTQITSILNAQQVREWKRMQRDWKDDFTVPKS